MKQILALSGAVLLLIAACGKKETPVENSDPSTPPEQSAAAGNKATTFRLLSDWDDAENSSNPADTAGLIHNLIVDYTVTAVSASLPASRAYDTSVTFAKSYFGPAFDETDFRTKISVSLLEDLLADTTSKFYNTIDDMRNTRKVVKDKLKNLVDVLFDTASLPADVPYDTIKNRIVAWEAGIGTPSFTASEQTLLYHVGAVARYSMSYWIKKHDHEWDVVMTPAERAGTTKKRKWWQWLIIGVADAAGVVAGAVTGNVVGGIAAGASASNTAYNLTQ